MFIILHNALYPPLPPSHQNTLPPLWNQNFNFLTLPNRIFSELFTCPILEEGACHAFQGKTEIFCNHPPICPILHNNFVVIQTWFIAALPLQVNVKKEFIVTEVETINFKFAKLRSLPQSDSCFIHYCLDTGIIINIFVIWLLYVFPEGFVFSSPFLS